MSISFETNRKEGVSGITKYFTGKEEEQIKKEGKASNKDSAQPQPQEIQRPRLVYDYYEERKEVSPNRGQRINRGEAVPREVMFRLEQSADESMLCPISTSLLTDPVILVSCGHTFQREHIEQWLMKRKECPLCKVPTDGKSVKPNFTVKSLVSAYVDKNLETIK